MIVEAEGELKAFEVGDDAGVGAARFHDDLGESTLTRSFSEAVTKRSNCPRVNEFATPGSWVAPQSTDPNARTSISGPGPAVGS